MKYFSCLLLIFINCSAIADAELYQSNYEQYWTQWNVTLKAFEKCNEPHVFLSSAVKMLKNAEITEANAQAIEKMALSNPKCLILAMTKLSETELKIMYRTFIRASLFHEPEELKSALIKEEKLNESPAIVRLLKEGRI